MHILDIPLACCLTPRSALLSISPSHFLSSTSPEAQSNRAHQTGWSVQNCNVLLIDLKSMSMYVEVRIHSMCDPLPTHCCFFWITYKHSRLGFVCVLWACIMCLRAWGFIPLLSAEPPWDEGDEEDDELEEVLCSIASKESSERRRSGLLKKDESRPFKYAVSSYKSFYFCLNTLRINTWEMLQKVIQNQFATLPFTLPL